MRYLVILLILSACGPKETLGSAPSNALSPAGCTFDQTISGHVFVNWLLSPQTADSYTCSFFAKMNCTYNESDIQNEILCEGISNLDPEGAPAGCTLIRPVGYGLHAFLDGTQALVEAYRCPNRLGNPCFYYQSGTNKEEYICHRY